MYIIKSIRTALLRRLREKAEKMEANGSNCADVLQKIKAMENHEDRQHHLSERLDEVGK